MTPRNGRKEGARRTPHYLAARRRDAWVLAERQKGRTLQQIADELGITRQRVQQIDRRARLPMQTR
jgi:DNA-directed RNA polymerase sigma subunit (sigma70/sigma32)